MARSERAPAVRRSQLLSRRRQLRKVSDWSWLVPSVCWLHGGATSSDELADDERDPEHDERDREAGGEADASGGPVEAAAFEALHGVLDHECHPATVLRAAQRSVGNGWDPVKNAVRSPLRLGAGGVACGRGGA